MKQREPRHAAKVPVRVRAPGGWADGTILNLSNRGLMFRSQHCFDRGHYLELRRGNHVIVARVVWSDGARCGARAQNVIPVADLLLDRPAGRGVLANRERRSSPRTAKQRGDVSRQRGRRLEFFFAGVGVTCAAILAADVTFSALGAPLRQVEAALSSP